MDFKRIIYYTRENDTGKTISLRDLCIKDEYDAGLETIFYVVRDSVSAQELLDKLNMMYHESFWLDQDDISCIIFKVTDCYDNTNYLKIRKVRSKNISEGRNDDD
jgi:hypothetical protein